MKRYLLTAGLIVGLAGFTASAQNSPSTSDPNQLPGVQSTPPTLPSDQSHPSGDMDRDRTNSQSQTQTDQDQRPQPDQNGVIHDRDHNADPQSTVHRDPNGNIQDQDADRDQQGTVYRDPNGQDRNGNGHVGDSQQDQSQVPHIDDRDQNGVSTQDRDRDRDNNQVNDQDQNAKKKHKKHKKHGHTADNDRDYDQQNPNQARDDEDRPYDQDRDRDRGAVGSYNGQQSTTGANDRDRDANRDRQQDRNYDYDRSGVNATNDLQSRIMSDLAQQGLQNVNVNVTDQAINLSGSVPTGKEKQTARRIAQTYANGRQVHEEITVTGRGHNQ